MEEGSGHTTTLTIRELPFSLACHCVNNNTSVPCKPIILLKFHAYDDNDMEEFSLISFSACLPYSNHLHFLSSDFNRFSFQKKSSTTNAKSTANFDSSILPSNDNRILIVDDEKDIVRELGKSMTMPRYVL